MTQIKYTHLSFQTVISQETIIKFVCHTFYFNISTFIETILYSSQCITPKKIIKLNIKR